MRLFHVRPASPSKRIANGLSANPILVSQCLMGNHAGAVSASDIKYGFSSQLRVPVALPFRCICPSPFEHIARVVFMRTAFKVRRIAAWRVVAFVAHYQPFWNWAVSQLESNAVRALAFAYPIVLFCEHAIVAIFTTKTSSFPRPTFTRAALVYFRPKAFYPSACFEFPIALMRAIFSRLAAHLPRGKFNHGSAVQTLTRFLYDSFGHVVHSFLVNALARPVRLFAQSFGPFSILPSAEAACSK